jgi:hypothetical protein
MEEIMKRLKLGIIVAIGLTLPAFANPPQLKGDYGFIYTDTCLRSTSGFNPNLTPLAGPVDMTSSGATGFEHFNGDGTGTVQGLGVITVDLASTPLGSTANTATFSFDFTYAFNTDSTFTMNVVPGSFKGTLPGGPTFTINPHNNWLGIVSNNGKMHTLTTVTPVIETITVNTSPSPTKILMFAALMWLGLH